MKLALFQQILELNQLFDRFTAGLERLESVSFFQRDLIYPRNFNVGASVLPARLQPKAKGPGRSPGL
jgi:hypothetical protein